MSACREMKVLIVEDEEGLRENLRDLLEDAGYRVTIARDGAEALRCLHEAWPSVVILDLLLPFVSGVEVYALMQRTPGLNKVPVVVTTSDPTSSPPGVPVIAKPFDLATVLKMVALCADGSSAA